MLSIESTASSFAHISRRFQGSPGDLRKQCLLRNMYNFTVETFAVDNPSKAAYASVTVRVRAPVRCYAATLQRASLSFWLGTRLSGSRQCGAVWCRSAAPRSSQPWRRRPAKAQTQGPTKCVKQSVRCGVSWCRGVVASCCEDRLMTRGDILVLDARQSQEQKGLGPGDFNKRAQQFVCFLPPLPAQFPNPC